MGGDNLHQYEVRCYARPRKGQLDPPSAKVIRCHGPGDSGLGEATLKAAAEEQSGKWKAVTICKRGLPPNEDRFFLYLIVI